MKAFTFLVGTLLTFAAWGYADTKIPVGVFDGVGTFVLDGEDAIEFVSYKEEYKGQVKSGQEPNTLLVKYQKDGKSFSLTLTVEDEDHLVVHTEKSENRYVRREVDIRGQRFHLPGADPEYIHFLDSAHVFTFGEKMNWDAMYTFFDPLLPPSVKRRFVGIDFRTDGVFRGGMRFQLSPDGTKLHVNTVEGTPPKTYTLIPRSK